MFNDLESLLMLSLSVVGKEMKPGIKYKAEFKVVDFENHHNDIVTGEYKVAVERFNNILDNTYDCPLFLVRLKPGGKFLKYL